MPTGRSLSQERGLVVRLAEHPELHAIAREPAPRPYPLLGAHAVIGMRQDIDLDTTAFQYFYLQMYGTAVKFRESPPRSAD
jgi:hypothetical protein